MSHARDNARLARTSGPNVATAQDLRDLTWFSDDPPEAAQTLGAVSVDDGGAGRWRWDATSTAADTLGTVLTPTSAPVAGRWLRVVQNSSVIEASWYGLLADPAGAIQAAIDSIGAWEQTNDPGYKYNTRTVNIPDGLVLNLAAKLVIPYNVQCMISCPSPQGTLLVYVGPGYTAVEVQPGARWHVFGVQNLAIENGDIATIGSNSGQPTFRRVSLYAPPSKGFWFVDAPDYTDGPGGEYPDGYTGPLANTSGEFNTVFFTVDECVVLFSNGNSIVVEATTYLLGRIRKPRLFGSMNTPLILDCIGVRVEDAELIGVQNYTTQPYIHFPCVRTKNSSIEVINCRFGNEDYEGSVHSYPAVRTVVAGPLTGTDLPAHACEYITFRDCKFFGRSDALTSEAGIYDAAGMKYCTVENSVFNSMLNACIEVAPHAVNTTNRNIYANTNKRLFNDPPPVVISPPEARWDEGNRAFSYGDTPTVSAEPGAGTGATATISSATDWAGKVVVNVGADPTADNVVTVTFAREYRYSPTVIMTPTSAEGINRGAYVTAVNTTSFKVRVITAMVNNLQFAYQVVQAGA